MALTENVMTPRRSTIEIYSRIATWHEARLENPIPSDAPLES